MTRCSMGGRGDPQGRPSGRTSDGSPPRGRTSEGQVQYAVLLADHDLIDWPAEGRAGRKPGKIAPETPMRDWEKKTDYV